MISTAVVVGSMAVPSGAVGQESSTIVGITGGYVSNEQIWSPASETASVGGAVVGAFARVVTPASWLHIQVEGTWTRRGGDVVLDEGGMGGIRTDYLTISLHPRAVLDLGTFRVHVGTGPTIDQLIRSQLDSLLGSVLDDEGSTVFAWAAEAGLGGNFGSRGIDVELALRIIEGLGDAYSGDFVSVRNRSYEAIARIGIPLPR